MIFPIEIQLGRWIDLSSEVFQSFPEPFQPGEVRTSGTAGVCSVSFSEEILELSLG